MDKSESTQKKILCLPACGQGPFEKDLLRSILSSLGTFIVSTRPQGNSAPHITITMTTAHPHTIIVMVFIGSVHYYCWHYNYSTVVACC